MCWGDWVLGNKWRSSNRGQAFDLRGTRTFIRVLEGMGVLWMAEQGHWTDANITGWPCVDAGFSGSPPLARLHE